MARTPIHPGEILADFLTQNPIIKACKFEKKIEG
jgi:plasmid maintenance system antidote protein VapI